MNERDALVWRASRDTFFNASMVAVAVLEGQPDVASVKAAIEDCISRVPRLTQIVSDEMSPIGTPLWCAYERFDLDLHFRQSRLPRHYGVDQVIELAQSSAMMPFDRSLPLWEFDFITDVDGHNSALIHKLHHSLVDGVGAMALMAHLYSPQPTAAASAPEAASATATDDPPRARSQRDAAQNPERAAPEHDAAVRTAAALLRRLGGIHQAVGREMTRVTSLSPARVSHALEPALKSANERLRSVGRLALPTQAAMSPIATRRSKGLRFASFAIEFEALHRAAKKRDCKLNDAFLTALAAGWRRYHSTHAADTPHLVCAFPINLRPLGGSRHAAAGNELGFGRLRVSLEQGDCEQQMREIHAEVRALRVEPALGLTEAIAGAANLLPRSVVHFLGPHLARQNDFAASCLPGPRQSLYFAGHRAVELHAFGPRMGSAVNFTLLSYAGEARVGVNADPLAIPDVAVLVDAMKSGFAEVAALG